MADINYGYSPADDLSEEEIKDLIYLNSSVIPGIESVLQIAGIRVNPWVHEKLLDWITEKKYTPDEITNAVKEMAKRGICSLPYIEGILRNGRIERKDNTDQSSESRKIPGSVTSEQETDGRKPFSKYVC